MLALKSADCYGEYLDGLSVLNDCGLESGISRLLDVAKARYERFSEGDQTTIVWGFGFLGRWIALTQLDKDGFRVFDTYGVQDDCGLKIQERAGLISDTNKYLIASRHHRLDIEAELPANSLSIGADEWFIGKNSDAFKEVYLQLEDHKSKHTYHQILLALLTGRKELLFEVYEPNIYFTIPGFSHTFDDFFVDAGAYVGDTVEDFIRNNMGGFKGIAAFEPGPRQFRALQYRLERLEREWAFNPKSIRLFQAGLSDEEEAMGQTFENDHILRQGLKKLESKDLSQENKVQTLRLDDLPFSKEITFIKADVEGMELRLLDGAISTIRNNTPKLAISAYHYPEDLLKIPEKVKNSSGCSYRLYLRQHASVIGDYVYYFLPK